MWYKLCLHAAADSIVISWLSDMSAKLHSFTRIRVKRQDTKLSRYHITSESLVYCCWHFALASHHCLSKAHTRAMSSWHSLSWILYHLLLTASCVVLTAAKDEKEMRRCGERRRLLNVELKRCSCLLWCRRRAERREGKNRKNKHFSRYINWNNILFHFFSSSLPPP